MRRAHRFRPADVRPDIVFVPVLDAKLHEPHPERHQPLDPVGVSDDQVKGIERAGHGRKALPMTGVEGSAISRGSMGPAS